jgi:Secretion system C-terminal sorting domain/FG-GAP-like repeat
VDRDGDMDVVIGTDSSVLYYENIGSATVIDLVRRVGISNPFDSIQGTNMAPALVDIDTDGDIDLFVGDDYGKIYFYKNGISTATGGGGEDTGGGGTTAVDAASDRAIICYPNPVTDILTLVCSHRSAASMLEIINAEGIVVRSTQIEADRQQIDIATLHAGLYLLRMDSGVSYQIVKQ